MGSIRVRNGLDFPLRPSGPHLFPSAFPFQLLAPKEAGKTNGQRGPPVSTTVYQGHSSPRCGGGKPLRSWQFPMLLRDKRKSLSQRGLPRKLTVRGLAWLKS